VEPVEGMMINITGSTSATSHGEHSPGEENQYFNADAEKEPGN